MHYLRMPDVLEKVGNVEPWWEGWGAQRLLAGCSGLIEIGSKRRGISRQSRLRLLLLPAEERSVPGWPGQCHRYSWCHRYLPLTDHSTPVAPAGLCLARPRSWSFDPPIALSPRSVGKALLRCGAWGSNRTRLFWCLPPLRDPAASRLPAARLARPIAVRAEEMSLLLAGS